MPRLVLLFPLLFALITGCGPTRPPVPIGVIPREKAVSREDAEYGHQVLRELTKQYPLSQNQSHIDRVQAVVRRLIRAIDADRVPWKVYVLDDDMMKNAAATRGNYMFVWSGMLYTVQNDDELATVLSHEIGHVLAGHTMPNPAEEARQMVSGIAGVAARAVLANQGYAGLAAGAAQQATQEALKAFLVNPEAQRKEFEADQIGLFILADAGINPEKGVRFWDRVRNDPDFGGRTLEFLSSHPSSERRMMRLRDMLPDAMARYRRAGAGEGRRSGPHGAAPGDDDTRSARSEPSPRMEPRNAPVLYKIRDRRGFLLDGPNRDGRPIATLSHDDQVEAECREGPWIFIRYPSQGFIDEQELFPVDVFPKEVPPCGGSEGYRDRSDR